MRYLKRQTLNRRVANDTTLYSDVANANVYVSPTGQGSLVLPTGGDSSIPGTPVVGMMRYNTSHDEVQVYQGSAWRSVKFKEASPIIQQSLGIGDANTVYFGPLSSAYNPANISSNVPVSGGQGVGQYGGQNILVVVENVLQLYNTNYTIEQNPTIGGETYAAVTSVVANTGTSTMYFNSSLTVTGASGSGTVATLTFATQPAAPFAVGATIIVTGMTPSAYNGSFTVTAASTTSVSYSSTAVGSMVFPGTIAATTAVYPAVNITGAIITGSVSIQSNTTIQTYTVDSNTGALTSITFNKPLITNAIPSGTAITIAEGSQPGTGYYLKFSSPVPYSKAVTVLLGFDH
jgi:hypothetical protein